MIYFLTSDVTGDRVKIGYTSRDPSERAKEFGLDATVLATMEGGRQDEKRLHHRYRRWRVGRSEWFVMCPEISQLIRDLQGEPSASILSGAIENLWTQAGALFQEVCNG